jgi:hypothetical protein
MLTAIYLGCLHPQWASWKWYSAHLSASLAWLSAVLAFGLLATAVAAFFTLIPGLVIHKARRSIPRPRRRSA